MGTVVASPSWLIQGDEIEINWSPGNLLGKGGYGLVYKGIYRGSAVAVKMLKGEAEAQPLTSLQKEVDLMVQLRHPHIIQVGVISLTNELCCSLNGPSCMTN